MRLPSFGTSYKRHLMDLQATQKIVGWGEERPPTYLDASIVGVPNVPPTYGLTRLTAYIGEINRPTAIMSI